MDPGEEGAEAGHKHIVGRCQANLHAHGNSKVSSELPDGPLRGQFQVTLKTFRLALNGMNPI